MNHPNKLKLHDTFIIDEDKMTWHGVQSRWPQMELSECETDGLVSKIRDYLSKKERLNFYEIRYPDKIYYKSLSEDDVKLIKEQFDTEYMLDRMMDYADPDDFPEDEDWYSRTPSIIERRDDPLSQLFEIKRLYAGEQVAINLGRVVHYYAMSKTFCDVENGEIKKKVGFGVELSDDDYVYLVYLIITHNHEYFLSDLFIQDPELAKKIYLYSMWSKPFGDEDVKHLPFLISFDELEEDARMIESERITS